MRVAPIAVVIMQANMYKSSTESTPTQATSTKEAHSAIKSLFKDWKAVMTLKKRRTLNILIIRPTVASRGNQVIH